MPVPVQQHSSPTVCRPSTVQVRACGAAGGTVKVSTAYSGTDVGGVLLGVLLGVQVLQDCIYCIYLVQRGKGINRGAMDGFAVV